MVVFVNTGSTLDVVPLVMLVVEVTVVTSLDAVVVLRLEVLKIIAVMVDEAMLLDIIDGAHMLKISDTTLRASLVRGGKQDVSRQDVVEFLKLGHWHIPEQLCEF
jgi:hypothetical protein